MEDNTHLTLGCPGCNRTLQVAVCELEPYNPFVALQGWAYRCPGCSFLVQIMDWKQNYLEAEVQRQCAIDASKNANKAQHIPRAKQETTTYKPEFSNYWHSPDDEQTLAGGGESQP